MARGRHYAKLSLSNAARLSFSDLLLFMFLSLCRLCVCVFLCSHWSLVDVPLIFFCPADHVPDWQPRVLLGMVEARSVNVKKTTTTMSGEEDLMKQVEELKKNIREVEDKEEMRRGREEARVRGESRGREEVARGGEYMMRVSGAGGLASRAVGSAVHVKQQGTENNGMRQFYFPSGHLNTRPLRFPTDPAKVPAWWHQMMIFLNSTVWGTQ